MRLLRVKSGGEEWICGGGVREEGGSMLCKTCFLKGDAGL